MSQSAFKAGYDKIDWRPLPPVHRNAPDPVARSDFPCPRVVSDVMPSLSHVDGRTYDSLSAYRAVTKREGYIELGNDPARLRPPEKPKRDTKKLDDAIHRAIAEII